ncbi:hypothetical protein [Bacteroides sp. UBA939]|uniref:hypothetical protein n=1 Tax=Bacteroides sp. UBA939 TaxID=1946092 RepID=UPI0025B87095|nr:hypothetical protein [Bacteroides sp. UBA939]
MAKFAVLHLEKGVGNDAPISSHIERTVNPANADKDRTHLNRELIEFPDGVRNRTEAIQYRIEHAGIARKISHNQVRAIRVMMTGSPEQMQNTYAQAMSKFGLVRGKESSEARHISTQQYYRELVDKNEDLKEIIQEQEELNLIHNLFPMMKEQLRIADLCKTMGLAVNSIKALLEGRNLTAKTFSFFSPEHKQKFTAEDVKLKMEKEPDNPDKLQLNLNGQNIIDWFREQYQRVIQATNHYVRPNIKPEAGKNKSFKL